VCDCDFAAALTRYILPTGFILAGLEAAFRRTSRTVRIVGVVTALAGAVLAWASWCSP
jgi:hypothetical protein